MKTLILLSIIVGIVLVGFSMFKSGETAVNTYCEKRNSAIQEVLNLEK